MSGPNAVRSLTWKVFDHIPPGWRIDKTAGSPVAGCVFITNGKSVIAGQERALLKVRNEKKYHFTSDSVRSSPSPIVTNSENSKQSNQEVALTMNRLAREKLKQKLLADILVDLTICEIEGWCKLEYIRELQDLVNDIRVNTHV